MPLRAQQAEFRVDDSEWMTSEELKQQSTADTSSVSLIDSVPLTQKEMDRLFWKPNPGRAVWLGAVVPGLGETPHCLWWIHGMYLCYHLD